MGSAEGHFKFTKLGNAIFSLRFRLPLSRSPFTVCSCPVSGSTFVWLFDPGRVSRTMEH